MIYKLFLQTNLLLLLTSCAAFKEKISTKNLNHLKKIIIISDLGPSIQYHYAGATALRNREQQMPINWNLDHTITQIIHSHLKQNPHFEVLEIKGADLPTHPYFDQLITAKKNGAEITPYLEQLLQQGFDGLVLVQAWRQIEDTTIKPGYGVFYDNRLLVHDQNLYLTARIRVYSTHKKTELSSIDMFKNPYIELESFPKRKQFEEWPTSDLNSLKDQLEQKLTHEIPFRLKKLGLL